MPRARSGEPCKRCLRKGSACVLHGGKSTGPRSEEGKKVASKNATKHGLFRDPRRVVEDMSPELKALWGAQVDEICRAEGISAPLDRSLVESFVTACFMESDARNYVLTHGVVSAEVYAEIISEHGTFPVKDVEGNQVVEPFVSESLVKAYSALARLKRDLHAQLRTGTGKTGDLAKIPVRVLAFDPSGYPEPKGEEGDA